jgi:hypothetical protein
MPSKRRLLTIKAESFASVLGKNPLLRSFLHLPYSSYVLPDLFWQHYVPGTDPFHPDILLESQNKITTGISLRTFTNIGLNRLAWTNLNGSTPFCRNGHFNFHLFPITNLNRLLKSLTGRGDMEISLCYGIASADPEDLIFLPSLCETTMKAEQIHNLTDNARENYRKFLRSLELTHLVDLEEMIKNSRLKNYCQFSELRASTSPNGEDFLWV